MESNRAKEIVAGFEGKKVLVVGDVLIDRHVRGNVERLNPEAPVPILHAKEEENETGGAGNVAKNLAKLGAQARLVSVMGDDTMADKLVEACQREGYAAELSRDTERLTIQKIRYWVNNQQLLRVDFEEAKDISDGVEDEIVAKITEHGPHADAVFVSDYAKGSVTAKVAAAVMGLSKSVIADVKPSRAGWFAGATYISPNLKEAHEYLGLDQFDQGGKDPKELAVALKEKFQSTVFLTLSAGGVYVLGDEEGHVAQEHVSQVADTSGCGDTAAAAILLSKLAGATDLEAAEMANGAGAVVVQKAGAVAITTEELLDMLEHKHE